MKVTELILKTLLIQVVFCLIIFLMLTAVRFFDSNGFKVIKEIYLEYAHYDTNISLVYEGK